MTGIRFLVAGGDRVDAGKTTFSIGLLAHLRERGGAPTGDTTAAATRRGVVGVKPRAGNDYWFDHDDVRAAIAEARLYGKDARRLAAASAGELDATVRSTVRGEISPERINPLHRLWRPTPGRTGLLGESGRTFLVDRVSTPEGPAFVVNGRAEDDGLLPARLTESLPLEDARRVRKVSAFNDVMSERYLPAFDRLAERVTGATDPVVVESYADVAFPLDASVDAVAVVAPARARIYAADRYEKASDVAAGSPREGQLEERTGVVTDMIEPLETIDLPALADDERSSPDRIADAYEPAYDALLDAA